MSMNTIFSFLMPKEDKFFPLINQLGDALEKAAQWQVEFFESFDADHRAELRLKVKSC